MLEKYLLEADLYYLNKQHIPVSGYFDSFIDTQFENVELYLLKKTLTYSKLNFVRSRFSNIADVGKQSVIDYLKALPYALEWSFK